MSLGLTQCVPESFSFLSSFSFFFELFMNWWICVSGRDWSCGGKHADDWRFATISAHSIFSICVQWSELGIRWCFPSISAWTSMIMDLTLVSINFLEYPNGLGWCQHKIFGGEDQKSWTLESAIRISVLCKLARRHWGWIL